MDQNIYREHKVDSSLRPYVRRLMVGDSPHHVEFTIRPKPTGYTYLNWVVRGVCHLKFGDTLRTDDSPIFFSGQLQHHDINVDYRGQVGHVACEFTALGFYQLTGMPGRLYLGRAEPMQTMRDDLRLSYQHMVAQVRGLTAPDDIQLAFRLIVQWLHQAAAAPHEVPVYLTRGVAAIEQNDGLVRIEQVCDQIGISERQFTRRFSEIVGLPPKFFARVLQVNKALQALLEDDRDYLAGIAQAAGYYDEAHFIRVIREFFDDNPTSFLNSRQETIFEFLGKSRKLS